LFITAYINENTFDAVNTGLPGTVPNAEITCRRLSEADWWGANLYGKQTGGLKRLKKFQKFKGFKNYYQLFELMKPLEPVKPTCSSSYDGSFSVFFYAYASQFYDASFFYHKAYSNNF
jgi:hypothetical protein